MGQEIASDDHELVRMVPVVKKLLKKLFKMHHGASKQCQKN